MSNIPKARELIEAIVEYVKDEQIRYTLYRALKLMKREPYIRRARPVRQVITAKMRRGIHKLNPDLNLTQVDIARRVGLRNQARVSEILNEKR